MTQFAFLKWLNQWVRVICIMPSIIPSSKVCGDWKGKPIGPIHAYFCIIYKPKSQDKKEEVVIVLESSLEMIEEETLSPISLILT